MIGHITQMGDTGIFLSCHTEKSVVSDAHPRASNGFAKAFVIAIGAYCPEHDRITGALAELPGRFIAGIRS
jgi:hypothetical protein